ncbi:DNA adenine methylase [Chloroflexota bacterium]
MASKSENRNYSRIKPPFGYYGSKHRLAFQIIKLLPPHNAWVEAFCGSAAITLAKPPAPIEIINDMDDQIINLFQQLRENQQELCQMIALTPYASAEHARAREHDETATSLEKARQFLVATMMTVNGANGGKSSGFSFSQSYSRGGNEARVNRWYHLPERLERVAERLRTIRIEKRDARELVDMFKNKPATLVYLDPPYNINRKQRYNYDVDDESFHINLLNKCIESKSMIMISGYDNELYNSLLTEKLGWTKLEIYTSTRDTSGKDYPRTEVIWRNQSCYSAHITKQVPIELSSKEIQYNKVNPSR